MPLVKSGSDKAFKTNVGNLMREVGKSPHVQSHSQALAIAYDVKRRNRAIGGSLKPAGWQTRSEARSMLHSGPINSMVPGRTDHHNMKVSPGSYVVNADTVSHLGQSNSVAGHAILSQMFGAGGPYGSGSMKVSRGPGAPRPPKMRAEGGIAPTGDGAPVEIMAAGGEYVIDPSTVTAIGNGDIDLGHKILDQWMEKVRKDHIRTLRRLPGPAKK